MVRFVKVHLCFLCALVFVYYSFTIAMSVCIYMHLFAGPVFEVIALVVFTLM